MKKLKEKSKKKSKKKCTKEKFIFPKSFSKEWIELYNNSNFE